METTSNMWWIGPLVLILLRVLYTEARLARATVKADAIFFRAALGVRILMGSGIVGFLILIRKSVGHEETWLLIAGSILVILMCFVWPATIVIENDALRRHLWWKRIMAIPWNEVSAIEKNKGGDLRVFGNNGQCITFTRYHVDPFRFEIEVKRRAGLDRTLDTGALPSIR
jgi:hypothetical protein